MKSADTATTTGKIDSIRDCGSIIMVSLEADEGGLNPIYFDRRMFGWLLEGEQCQPDDLVGRQVEYDGETLIFLD